MSTDAKFIKDGTLPESKIDAAFQSKFDGKAGPISITGSHTETEPEIDFATVQGKTITLTADRSYTITGLSNTNPAGLLEITHNGFTPSFSGVTELESMIDQSGVYYLRFTRNPSGTIIQTNQGGTGSVTLATTELVIDSVDVLSLYATSQQLKATPGASLIDRIVEVWADVDFKTTAYDTNTILNLLSGSIVIGTCDCLGATSSGRYKFELTGAPVVNGALSVQTASGEALNGDSDIGLIAYYEVVNAPAYSFATYDGTTLGTTAEISSLTSSTTRRRGMFVLPAADGYIDSIVVRHDTSSGNITVGVYSDSSVTPNALTATSTSQDCATTGHEWTTHLLTTPIAVSKGTPVWIAWVYDSATSTGYYTTFGTAATADSSTYELADPFGSYGSGALQYGAYANVRYDDSTYNYIINESFEDWTDSTIPDGWTDSGAPDGTNYVEENANGMRFVSDGKANFGIQKVGALTSGQVYFAEIDVYSRTTNGLLLYTDAQFGTILRIAKTVHRFTAGSDDFKVLRYSGGCELIVKNIKIWQ